MNCIESDLQPFNNGADTGNLHEPKSVGIYISPLEDTDTNRNDPPTSTGLHNPPLEEQTFRLSAIDRTRQSKEVCDDKKGTNSAVILKPQSTPYPGDKVTDNGKISGILSYSYNL